MNLDKIRSFATEYCKQKLISESDLKDILAKTDQMSQEIESSPKSMKWKLRARVGTQRKWYKDVEDIQY
jgi:hypothetical protein